MSIASSVPVSAMRVGRYEVLRRIAVSDVAELVLARLVGLSDFRKLVVLKWIRSDLDDVERLQALFAREARIAARLDHPNIVHTVDFGLAQGRQFVAMEYVHGETLASTLARAGALPLDCAVRIVTDVLGALDYAHTRADDDGSSLGIVHRDVSPANVLITYEGHVMLADFGIARAAAWEDLTYTGEIRGKVDYSAPEQARGETTDRRADVYSAGIMLGRLLGDRHRDLAAAIIEHATAADRGQRYATAAAMRDDLLALARARSLDMSNAPLARVVRAAFGERPHPSAAPQSWFAGLQAATAPAPTPRRSRAPVRRWMGLAVAAVLAIGIGMWIARDVEPDPPPVDTPARAATRAPPVDDAATRSPEPQPVRAKAPIAAPADSASLAPAVPRRAEPKRVRPAARRQTPGRTAQDPDAALPTRENR